MHADELRDHWWWRPGWRRGTRYYTWYVTFQHQTGLHRLVDRYQSVVAKFSGFRLVPRRWLHLTVQGVDHVHAVDTPEVDAVITATRARLAAMRPITVEFERAVVWPEAIVLPAQPSARIEPVTSAIRSAVRDVLGDERFADFPDGSRPHVSLAYSCASGSADAVAAAVDRVSAPPISVDIESVALTELNRDHGMYRWRTIATASISSAHR
ncbi:hypothetical protein GCM10009743_33030 [Kribbella swartbergensis]